MSNAPASPQAGGGRASMKKELPERFNPHFPSKALISLS